MSAEWQTGIFTSITNETPSTRRFRIKLPKTKNFDFQPGQFVQLDLPIHEKPTRRWRSYSIASAPDGTNEIELVIVLLNGGAGSTYLFENVKEGCSVPVRGPQGVFVLPEIIVQDLYFICTGTGIAPFRSMVNFMHAHEIPHKEIFLIFGTRYQHDLLYAKEMKELEEKVPGFHYLPTLSREESPEWKGEKGYVHAVYEDLLKDKPPADFYLCGWKEMIVEAKKRLLDLDYNRKQIHQELYG